MQILAFGTGCWLASYKLSLQAAAIPQLTCCWRRVTQARRALTPQPSRFCSLWLTPAPPPPRSAPGQAPQGLPSELRDVLLRSTSPSTRSNPVPRPPWENLSFSNSEEELVNKEERGSISENIFSRGSGGAERICWLTAGTGREGKGRQLASPWGRRHVPERCCGQYRKSCHLQQQRIASRGSDTHCFHSTQRSFPSWLKSTLNMMSLQHSRGVKLQLERSVWLKALNTSGKTDSIREALKRKTQDT